MDFAFIFSLIGLCQFFQLSPTFGYPNGAPVSSCKDMIPQHKYHSGNSIPPRTSESSPYKQIISKDKVKGGETIRIRLAALPNNPPFKGFLSIPTSANGKVSTDHGRIRIQPNSYSYVKTLDCFGVQSSAITHSSNTPKPSIEFDWITPIEGGEFVISTTFVQDYNTFWAGVRSQVIYVEKNSFFPTEGDENTHGENPDKFGNIFKELKENYYAGCGEIKGCFGFPENCYAKNDEECEMFTSWSYNTKNKVFDFQVAGKLPGWNTYYDTTEITEGHVSTGLSHDDEMGADSVIGCVLENGSVKPKSYFNLPNGKQNSMFANESTGLGRRFGKYLNGYIMCEFARTPQLFDETKEIGRNFDLIKQRHYILMARARSMSSYNGREKLGYHEGVRDKIVSPDAIDLSAGYDIDRWSIPPETTTTVPYTTSTTSPHTDTHPTTKKPSQSEGVPILANSIQVFMVSILTMYFRTTFC